MREIGKGYEGLSKFRTAMNMPPPMSKASYDNCVDEIHWVYELEKGVSLQKVAYQLKFLSAQSLLMDHGKQEAFHLSMEW